MPQSSAPSAARQSPSPSLLCRVVRRLSAASSAVSVSEAVSSSFSQEPSRPRSRRWPPCLAAPRRWGCAGPCSSAMSAPPDEHVVPPVSCCAGHHTRKRVPPGIAPDPPAPGKECIPCARAIYHHRPVHIQSSMSAVERSAAKIALKLLQGLACPGHRCVACVSVAAGADVKRSSLDAIRAHALRRSSCKPQSLPGINRG